MLHLEIDPTQVDVNVHPRKLEVRFANEKDIFRAFYHAVEEKLTNTSLIPTNNSTNISQYNSTKNINNDFNSGQTRQFYTGSGTKFKFYSPYKDTSPNPNQGTINEALDFSTAFLGANETPEPKVDTTDISETPLGKIIGQVHNSYIVVQTPSGIQILDQHALAERIIYEKLVKKDTLEASQGLLISEQIKLTSNEQSIVEEYSSTFIEIGFDFEIIPGNILLINAIPEFIKKEKIRDIFL